MSIEVKIHAAQISILRELLFVRQAGYAALQQPTGLTSDHFNFHIARLVELGLVEKLSRGQYRLTLKGKEYANKLDTDEKTIERQPKVAVLLGIEREQDGQCQYLFQERAKNPYYGYYGLPSGKMRWGETILEAAARELKEETGLTADYSILGLYHEHTFIQGSTEPIEDKLFFIVNCTNPQGELVEQFEGGVNHWMTAEESRGIEKKYTSFETELEAVIKHRTGFFIEETHYYQSDEF